MIDEGLGSFYDGVKGHLWEGFRESLALATDSTHFRVLGPNVEKLSEFLEPHLFIVLRYTERSGVGGAAQVLVQGFGDEVDVPRIHPLRD